MISGAQVRMARGYLKWSAKELAERAGVAESTVKRIEAEDGFPAARGANIEAQDGAGDTPLMHACQKGRVDIVRLLLAKGARRDARNLQMETASTIAEREGKAEIAKLLKERWYKRIFDF